MPEAKPALGSPRAPEPGRTLEWDRAPPPAPPDPPTPWAGAPVRDIIEASIWLAPVSPPSSRTSPEAISFSRGGMEKTLPQCLHLTRLPAIASGALYRLPQAVHWMVIAI